MLNVMITVNDLLNARDVLFNFRTKRGGGGGGGASNRYEAFIRRGRLFLI